MNELRRFFLALAYFTRIPVPAWVGWQPDELNRAARYFPLVGLLVGAVAAAVLWLAAQVLPLTLAVLLSMAASILLTGAFHEDGLADSADGFGGGYTPQRVLEIMKDSRIGSFGAIALVLVLLGKHQTLLALDLRGACIALLVMHPASRWAALLVMGTMRYVRGDDADARAKPVAEGIGCSELVIGSLCGLLPLAALATRDGLLALGVLLSILAVTVVAGAWFRRRIGGYTGDCLGALQQLAELAGCMTLLALAIR
ncbi:adenosylcobinamide-GDP ribazoletransferase [Uliginosibacterium sp. H1]|uniref:adenosylcobinamide-GDP ribazoletransferase n=1 Tax=Uliginosibacterium sp. H1 TaxID=3114757 RepID=UPI002E18B447|nr:adenosylcobinamide-GDP ribazoletransferase [Uliginosibacterium sp. H1]